MLFARLANFRVESDSLNASYAGDTIAIMVVIQFPPSESSSNLVNFESRYGMCARVSARAEIT